METYLPFLYKNVKTKPDKMAIIVAGPMVSAAFSLLKKDSSHMFCFLINFSDIL